ncbi:response regulator [Dyadobacter psychrophilus]|uniref:Response regulator receiver domain-containing protein n=1 Tax=Dyadobacter psychrophilus TaxID=651661 RepID=A0A1T5E1T0_9BACT|nr:response regulator [Dyadobacter psychrophilus]SKB77710.1 Response regulator receiver domain-containing protein [Dyadobacter psychrophilus]
MQIPSNFIVVDDDPINNIVCKYVIANFAPLSGIQLFTNAEHALEWFRNEFSSVANDKECVLFLDINMPLMSGWEFLDEFVMLPDTLKAKVNIFILSSSIDPEDRDQAENHPLVHGYYSKPLSKETLNLIYQQD